MFPYHVISHSLDPTFQFVYIETMSNMTMLNTNSKLVSLRMYYGYILGKGFTKGIN